MRKIRLDLLNLQYRDPFWSSSQHLLSSATTTILENASLFLPELVALMIIHFPFKAPNVCVNCSLLLKRKRLVFFSSMRLTLAERSGLRANFTPTPIRLSISYWPKWTGSTNPKESSFLVRGNDAHTTII